MSWFLGAVNGDAFVSSFCTPEHYENIFQNFLGGLTPCFCDVILLGALLVNIGDTASPSGDSVRLQHLSES